MCINLKKSVLKKEKSKREKNSLLGTMPFDQPQIPTLMLLGDIMNGSIAVQEPF